MPSKVSAPAPTCPVVQVGSAASALAEVPSVPLLASEPESVTVWLIPPSSIFHQLLRLVVEGCSTSVEFLLTENASAAAIGRATAISTAIPAMLEVALCVTFTVVLPAPRHSVFKLMLGVA